MVCVNPLASGRARTDRMQSRPTAQCTTAHPHHRAIVLGRLNQRSVNRCSPLRYRADSATRQSTTAPHPVDNDAIVAPQSAYARESAGSTVEARKPGVQLASRRARLSKGKNGIPMTQSYAWHTVCRYYPKYLCQKRPQTFDTFALRGCASQSEAPVIPRWFSLLL